MDVSMNPEPNPRLKLDPRTLSSLRVRCPDCRKLYLVRLEDIREVKPRFECVQCHLRFWVTLPDYDLDQEVIGTPMLAREMPKARISLRPTARPGLTSITCPKCAKVTSTLGGECEHCGVVLEKYKITHTSPEGVPPHSPALATAWQAVVADYANETLHDDFVRQCQRERNLALASAHYASMRSLMPTDELTGRRLREVQALGLTLLSANTDVRLRVPRSYPRLWQIPLMGATLVLIVGMVLPMFRNVAAIGAALLFLAVMLRFYRR